MTTEAQGREDEAAPAGQSDGEQAQEAQRSEQTGADGDAQAGINPIQRAIAQALEQTQAQVQDRVAQEVGEREQQGEGQQPASSEERQSSRQRRTKNSSSGDDNQGSTTMATNSNQTSQQDTDEQDNDQAQQPQQQANDQPQGGASSSSASPPARQSQSSPARRGSGGRRAQSPAQVARLGRLRMAREWRDQGSVYEAIHAYEEILVAYPGTGVAATAVDDLVEMAKKLEADGQFHAALDLYHRIEQLGVDR